MYDDPYTCTPSSERGWRDEALAARAALYLLKVAAAHPHLTRHDAWMRERLTVLAHMEHGCREPMGEAEWRAWDWRRDTLELMVLFAGTPLMATGPIARHRARIMALLDGV